MVAIRSDVRPSLEQVIALYAAAPLYRPVHDAARMQRIFDGSNVVLTAWDGDRLVGMLRGLTDGAFNTFICDLAIHPDVQRGGVGRQLLDAVAERYPDTALVLQASRIARDYYGHIGWQKVDNAWTRPRPAFPISEAHYQTLPSG